MDLRRASMGPPPFGDGNQLKNAKAARTAEMETDESGGAEWTCAVLQWGHRLSAMETSNGGSEE